MKTRPEFDILIVIALGIVLTSCVILLGAMSNYSDAESRESCVHTHTASVRVFDSGKVKRVKEIRCDTYIIQHCIDWAGQFCTAYK